MKKSTFKILMMACFILIAGYSNGQVKLGDKSAVGQTYVKSAETQSAILTIDFNTDQGTSTWTKVDETTTTISWAKCQNNKGFAATVWAADTANAPTVNPNDDLRVRSGRWRSNENPVHVASVDSLQALLAKYAEVNAGTPDSAKNTLSKPSACLFDVNGDNTNQAYGMHPGIYKKLEHEIVFTFKSMKLTSDLQFTIDTYDAGNTGQTATYSLRAKFGSMDTTLENFYVTGSGLKQVKLAEAIGEDISVLDGQNEVHIYLNTNGTGTAIAEGTYDPTIVVDDMTVTFAAPVWVEPAGGLDGGTFSNAEAPFMGVVGEETTVAIPLKIKGRVAPLTIEDNLYKNDRGDEFNKMLTFPDTLGIMANDGSGNYTVEVPYSINPAVFDIGGQKWSKQKITVDAPDVAGEEDMMFYLKVLPEAATYHSNMEIDAGVRIFYQAFVSGIGSSVVDLTGVEDGYILQDTLPGVADGSTILLAPGKMYYIGGYAFDKSLEFASSDPSSAMKPLVDCSSAGTGYGSNFDMVADAAVDYIIFRNLKFTGSFGDNYVMNISKQSSINSVVFESCEAKSLRGIVRIKDNPSTIENYTVNDCVMDSINNYGLLTMDKDGGMVNNITVSNSTFSHFTYFIVSRNNSDKVSILYSTLSEVPEKGRQLLRYRGGDGSNNIITELQIEKTIIGHGWNMAGETDYGIKGKEGLDSTPLRIKNVYATSDFAYSSDTIPGLPTHTFDASSMELWVDMMNGNFNFTSMDNANKGVGDPRWAYEDTTTQILYAGANPPDAMHFGDSILVDELTAAGYNVTYVDDNDIGVAGYDYSPYDALVVGESTSSSRIVPFGKDDNYPIPLVSLEAFGVKTNKWPWLADDTNFQESRSGDAGTLSMKILDNTHYITEVYAADEVVTWSAAAPSTDIYAWGIDLTSDVSGAIGLGQSQNPEITTPMLWAVPIGNLLGASGQTNSHRIVIFATNAEGMVSATSDFNNIVIRSIDWVLGEGPTTGAVRTEIAKDDVLVYPNPARNFAKVRFTMQESAEVNLSLYNMLGQKIEISTGQRFDAGVHEIDVNTQSLKQGIYIYVLEAGSNLYKGKLNIAK